MPSTSSRPMLRSMAGAASNVGQLVTTSFPDWLAEKPYCSRMLTAARGLSRRNEFAWSASETGAWFGFFPAVELPATRDVRATPITLPVTIAVAAWSDARACRRIWALGYASPVAAGRLGALLCPAVIFPLIGAAARLARRPGRADLSRGRARLQASRRGARDPVGGAIGARSRASDIPGDVQLIPFRVHAFIELGEGLAVLAATGRRGRSPTAATPVPGHMGVSQLGAFALSDYRQSTI